MENMHCKNELLLVNITGVYGLNHAQKEGNKKIPHPISTNKGNSGFSYILSQFGDFGHAWEQNIRHKCIFD